MTGDRQQIDDLGVKFMRAIVSVLGQDRIGIIAKVCTTLADNQVNVLDLSQTILQNYFTMVMLVETEQCPLPFEELQQRMEDAGKEVGVKIKVQSEDIFNAMHKI
mgnify:FL=1